MKEHRMGYRNWVVGMAVLMAAAAACPHAAAEEGKVGYVNLSAIFDGYERTKSSDAMLEKKGKQKEAELEGRMSELRKLRESLELLSEDAREQKAREIEEKADDLQRFRTSAARDLGRERDKIAKDILDEIQQGVNEFAKANGYAMIIDSRSLLYSDKQQDVTDGVLALLNKRVKPAAR
jgi:outer membrane protein